MFKTQNFILFSFFVLLCGQSCKASQVNNNQNSHNDYFLNIFDASCSGNVLTLLVNNNTGSILNLATTTSGGQIENLLYPNAVGDARAKHSESDSAVCYDSANVNFECGCAGDVSCGTITIDEIASTPFSILELPRGIHTLSLSCDGACGGTIISCVLGGFANESAYATAFIGST